ncbi:hypothetical protein IFR04_007038 [Cadophora malorum]|uniref:Uncharacterized protein n=1 Tax=Cadophora malorum TaxID=108018 RepID=A0A8H7WB53_9HELO|nr:hypothetical protein IFR04_007038 [Cadophora malorum]
MPGRKYHNPPKVNSEGRYECRYGCGTSYPREWECCRHEEQLCKLNEGKEERPRIPCEFGCGKAYLRAKDVRLHERTTCELNPDSDTSRANRGLAVVIPQKVERQAWYAGFGELKPNERGDFQCGGVEKTTAVAKHLAVFMNRFPGSVARDEHERYNCWKHLTPDSSSNAKEKAFLVRSALLQLNQLEAWSDNNLDWYIGMVQNPLKSGMTYSEWVAVFILQEAPVTLMEIDTPGKSNNQDENEQWAYPQYFGAYAFRQQSDSVCTADSHAWMTTDQGTTDETEAARFQCLTNESEAMYSEELSDDCHDTLARMAEAAMVSEVGSVPSVRFEDGNTVAFDTEDCDDNMGAYGVGPEVPSKCILRNNCNAMDRLGCWDCPWDSKEQYCEGSRFLHGFVECPNNVLLQLDNCATPYKSKGNVEWRPQCDSCFLEGRRIGIWMWTGRIDEEGNRVCDAARRCTLPVLEPYYQCEEHFMLARGRQKAQRRKAELRNVLNSSRASYGKAGFKISTSAQLAKFLTGKSISSTGSQWTRVRNALLEEQGVDPGKVLFLDTEFCSCKDGPPILMEVAVVDGRGRVVFETVINHEMTVAELASRAIAGCPHMGAACVAKVYGKVLEARTPGITLSGLADAIEDLFAGAVVLEWSKSLCDYHTLYKALSTIGRQGVLPAKESWLRPLLEWRKIVPGLSSWALEWSFDLMFPESDLKSHHRARVDALKLFYMSRKLVELMD